MSDYWSTSRDGQFYTSHFETRDEAIYEMLAQDGEKFWLGRVTDSWGVVNIRDHVDSLIEGIDCGLADHIYSDDPLIEISKEDTAELAGIIESFLVEHATLSSRIVDVEKFEERPDSEGVDQ